MTASMLADRQVSERQKDVATTSLQFGNIGSRCSHLALTKSSLDLSNLELMQRKELRGVHYKKDHGTYLNYYKNPKL